MKCSNLGKECTNPMDLTFYLYSNNSNLMRLVYAFSKITLLVVFQV